MTMKACPLCKQVFDDEKVCPVCGVDLTDRFSGLVIILKPEKSKVGDVILKNKEGKYAINIR